MAKTKINSIMQDERHCYVSGQKGYLHKHHIYGGPNRQISEEQGFWVYLAPEFHNMSDKGVHFNKDFDLFLKKECQTMYECAHTRQEFMDLIGRNYLDD